VQSREVGMNAELKKLANRLRAIFDTQLYPDQEELFTEMVKEVKIIEIKAELRGLEGGNIYETLEKIAKLQLQLNMLKGNGDGQ